MASDQVSLPAVLFILFCTAIGVVVYARILGADHVGVKGQSNMRSVLENLCVQCKKRANVPACSYFCALNAINVTRSDLPTLNGLFYSRADSDGLANVTVRWILGLEFLSDGTIRGFSTLRLGPNYQNYDVNGIYIGEGTCLLLLRTTFVSEEPVRQVETTGSEDPYDLERSSDPEAIGLKLTVVNQDTLHGITTGYTYVDRRGPFSLIFDRGPDTRLEGFFED